MKWTKTLKGIYQTTAPNGDVYRVTDEGYWAQLHIWNAQIEAWTDAIAFPRLTAAKVAAEKLGRNHMTPTVIAKTGGKGNETNTTRN